MSKPEIQAYIAKQMDSKDNERIASQDEVLELLTNIARGIEKEEVLSMCGDGCQEIIEKEVTAKDRVKALELLGKRYGIFIDKKELSGKINTTNPILENINKQLNGG